MNREDKKDSKQNQLTNYNSKIKKKDIALMPV